jgi:acylphosphatase
VHVRLAGRVQGVGFRAWTVHEARLAGLNGWVRNLRDGSLEAVICGDAAAVAVMLERLRTGPPGAVVRQFATSDAAEAPACGFTQKPTA